MEITITKTIVFGIGENGEREKMKKRLNSYLKSISYFKIIKIQKNAKKYIDKNDRFCNTQLPFIDGLYRLFERRILRLLSFYHTTPLNTGQNRELSCPT